MKRVFAPAMIFGTSLVILVLLDNLFGTCTDSDFTRDVVIASAIMLLAAINDRRAGDGA